MNVSSPLATDSSIPSFSSLSSERQEEECTWDKVCKKALDFFSQFALHMLKASVRFTILLSKELGALSKRVEIIRKQHFPEPEKASAPEKKPPSRRFIRDVIAHNCKGIQKFFPPLPCGKTSFSSQLFRGRMPLHLDIPQARLAHQRYLEKNEIKKVILLQENEKALEFYRSCGIEVEAFFIPDFDVPDPETLLRSCKALAQWLQNQKDQNVLVHCKAGLGRTGLYLCALYHILSPQKNAFDLVDTVRKQHPGAVETWEQARFLQDYFCNRVGTPF